MYHNTQFHVHTSNSLRVMNQNRNGGFRPSLLRLPCSCFLVETFKTTLMSLGRVHSFHPCKFQIHKYCTNRVYCGLAPFMGVGGSSPQDPPWKFVTPSMSLSKVPSIQIYKHLLCKVHTERVYRGPSSRSKYITDRQTDRHIRTE